LDEAKHEYETALSYGSDPTELAQAHNNLGALLMQLNQAAEAISQFDAAIRINPNKQSSFLGRGSVEYKQGNLDAALSDFSRAAQIAPSAAASFWIGRISEDKGDFTGASRAYQEALRLAPDMKESRSHLDAVLLKLNSRGVQ
jgi:tetratricopeptide (TPR) repeat protein